MDMLQLLRNRLDGPLLEKLGGAVGLNAAEAQKIGQAVLPAQVEALRQQAETPAGAQRLLDLASQVPTEDSQAPLNTPEGLEQVRQSGTALLPQVLGDRLDSAVGQIAAQTGSERSGVLGMMQMVLPFVLGGLGQQAASQGLNAGTLGGLFAGGQGGIGAAEAAVAGAGVAGVAAAGLGGAAAVGQPGSLSKATPAPVVPVSAAANPAALNPAAPKLVAGPVSTEGKATVGPGAGLGGGVLHSNAALGGTRGLGLLWLLPILLLLLLGGCFLVTGKPAAHFGVTAPANASAVAGAFMVKGTGTAGKEVTISENGQPVGKTTVAEDGSFNIDMAAPAAGAHTYALTEEGAGEALSLAVTAAAAATGTAATGTADAGTAATGTTAAGTASMPGMDMSGGTFAVTSPAAGTSLAAGAFDLKGTGKAGEVLEIFEDGVSLGKVTVGTDGAWSLNVPSPAAGAHTYTVKGPDGTELGSFQTTIAAAAASTAACTKTFSLSIPDGQTVAQPFRFGGVGSGKSYTVTVMRGERKIGSKVLPLDGTCGYSYTSKPGKGTISYSVAPTGSVDTAGKITLTVQ
ncbi:DUF937 domain-containing protein [Deinococcus altitudinis]|uniref:DUF937 domain-containing protein n=1 Tax=Deinococcus altitudinis TaxID=468914 RepID=UPI003892062C